MWRYAAFLLACGSNSAPVDATAPDAAEEPAVEEDAGEEDAGPVIAHAVWASTATALFTFDPETHALTKVVNLSCNGEDVLNIAVDRDETIYATTTESFVWIEKKTGACVQIAKGQYPRALGFVGDVLVGYSYAQLVRIDVVTGAMAYAGALNPNATGYPYSISGDLVAAVGKTFITALGDPAQGDALLEVTLDGGKVTKNYGYTGINGLVGLAQWGGDIYAFATNGRVYRITQPGAPAQVNPPGDASAPDGFSFFGAGVSPAAP